MDKKKIRSVLQRLDSLTDEDIAREIDGDPDAAPDMSDLPKGIRRVRGPQKNPTKQQVTLRLDRKVIEHFKADGPGWQTRLNDHLMRFIEGR